MSDVVSGVATVRALMRKLMAGAIAGLLPALALAADAPEAPAWAYPTIEPAYDVDPPPEDGTLYSIPGSNQKFTRSQIGARFGVPDWYPNEHPPMPDVVARGRQPEVRPCGRCHVPHGTGHPESAALAGLPVNYIIQQLLDYRSGARKSLGDRSDSMIAIASAMTDDEMRIAAEYYAKLPVIDRTRVVESDTVPETFVGGGNMRHAKPGGRREPIGQRIIEIPENSELQELEDAHSNFVAYVPPGSIAKGRELATTGGTKTLACGICHGPDLKGLGEVPRLVGLSPIYVFRQMMDIQRGARRGSGAALMSGPVARLSQEDMLNLAAYIGSLDP